MEQETVGPLELSVGYVLKQVQALLRNEMDDVLRPLDLTVPQYACLELLGRFPGMSNSDLARGAFVTRQSMNLVVQRLQERGLLTRPEQALQGRVRPMQLTEKGRDLLQAASVSTRAVEKRLFSPISPETQKLIREALSACVSAGNADQEPPDGASGLD